VISIQKSIYDPKSKNDGLRVLITQYWSRGVKKEMVNVWFKQLGTSNELIKEIRERHMARIQETLHCGFGG